MPPREASVRRLTAAERRRRTALAARRSLSRVCPRMAEIIRAVGPARRPVITSDPYKCLAVAIIQQQISMVAAASIQRKVEACCPRKRITPDALLALSTDELRAAGLSRQKALYLTGLSEAFASGELSSRRLRRMEDEAVIESVTRIKGIGRWTAEMLLIFSLERPDVWPIDDLGLRYAVAGYLGWSDGRLPGRQEMREAGEPFAPYRSYASWYLWRSREGQGMPGVKVK